MDKVQKHNSFNVINMLRRIRSSSESDWKLMHLPDLSGIYRGWRAFLSAVLVCYPVSLCVRPSD
jgi:hypothetical protein